jgi:hypothetical protein
MHNYTINENNTIEVFGEGETVPFLSQPNYPNGDSFDTREEAETWAQLFIEALVNEEAPYAPIGKGIPGEPKPTKEEMLAMLKERAEEFGENVPEQLAQRIADLEAEIAAS